MNEEELLREARIRSVAEPEELTFGELAGELELGAERERRFLQALALVAYRHAVLTARALAGQSLPPVGEAFPFWTEEELLAARTEHYRSMMERLAGRWRGKERNNGQGRLWTWLLGGAAIRLPLSRRAIHTSSSAAFPRV